MARGKTRLQTHYAQPGPPRRRVQTSSNTSTRVRRVFTTITTSTSNSHASDDEHQQSPIDGVPFDDTFTPVIPADVANPTGIHVRVKAKRYQNSVCISSAIIRNTSDVPLEDAPLVTWKKYRQEYLDTCLILDGCGRHNGHCASATCQRSGATFRCRDCFGYRLYCKACIIACHHDQPLHILEVNYRTILSPKLVLILIQEWKNSFFHRTTLQNLGLRVQLGHQSWSSCSFRHQGHKDFVVLHTNGIHSIDIDFCGCNGAPTHREQLLEAGWWPSTPLEPQSAASMAVLRSFHILNLQGQISPTDFYRSLEQMTVGNGLSDVPVSLPTQYTSMMN